MKKVDLVNMKRVVLSLSILHFPVLESSPKTDGELMDQLIDGLVPDVKCTDVIADAIERSKIRSHPRTLLR